MSLEINCVVDGRHERMSGAGGFKTMPPVRIHNLVDGIRFRGRFDNEGGLGWIGPRNDLDRRGAARFKSPVCVGQGS